MNLIFNRYIAPTLLFALIGAIISGLFIWFFDGALPTIVTVSYLICLAMCIPYLIFKDYKKVSLYVANIINAEIMRMSMVGMPVRESVFEYMKEEAIKKFGIPEFIARHVVEFTRASLKG